MRTAITVASLAAFGLVACGTVPKPQELESFEQVKASQSMYAAAQKRAPELVAESDKLFAKSQDEWQSNDIDESRRDALLGSVKLRTAYALVEQDQARARMKAADGEMGKAQEDYGRLTKELTGLNEQIVLQKKLAGTKDQAGASEKLRGAELALKNAESVNAAKNAQAEYQGATELLARARSEMQAGNYGPAGTNADLAKAKAEEAFKIAKPTFDKGEQSRTDSALVAALTRDASAIKGTSVKVDRRGEMQRIRVLMTDLFAGRSPVVRANKYYVLDQVADLIKKYPGFAVQVIGHTDSRGRHAQLVAVSTTQAESVFAALVSRGIDAKSATVSGAGPDEPAVPGRSSVAARAQNNRIEVVFLYK